MKMYVKLISTLLTVSLLISVGVVGAFAALPPVTFGDVDDANGVDITDATLIQRAVAKLEQLPDGSLYVADVDDDNKVTILDATLIQQHLAGMISEFPVGDYGTIDLYSEALVSDYNLGAYTNVPVTFTAIASSQADPLVYRFYVNDELVQEYSEKNTYVHTFDTPGKYEIMYEVKNKAGLESAELLELNVTEPVDTGWINITSLYHKGFYDYYTTFEAVAKDGLEPYEYSFDLCKLTDHQPVYGETIDTQDYSQSNSFTISKRLDDYEDYIIYVTVRDAQGHTATESLEFTFMTPPPA